MKIKSIFVLLMLSNIFSSKAQEVESTTYSLMLKALLSHTVQELSVKDAKLDSSIIYIDSREKQEYEVSHLPDALWIGYDQPNWKVLNELDKDQEIVVYCSVGYRSEKICEELKKRGYTKVSNLYGGIFEWVNQEKEIVDDEGKTTEKVHAYNKSWGIWLNKGEKVY